MTQLAHTFAVCSFTSQKSVSLTSAVSQRSGVCSFTDTTHIISFHLPLFNTTISSYPVCFLLIFYHLPWYLLVQLYYSSAFVAFFLCLLHRLTLCLSRKKNNCLNNLSEGISDCARMRRKSYSKLSLKLLNVRAQGWEAACDDTPPLEDGAGEEALGQQYRERPKQETTWN